MDEKPWLKKYDTGVPATLKYPQVPVFNFFETSAVKFPDRACTIFRDHEVSYYEMNSLIDTLAAGFVALGVRKGDRVGILLPNIPQFVLVYYAILKTGGVVVAVNPQYKQRELEFQLDDSGVEIIVGLTEYASLLKDVQLKTKVRKIILSKIGDASLLQNLLTLSPGRHQQSLKKILLASNEIQLCDLIDLFVGKITQGVEVTPDDVAIFQYSGGTTGIPKGAIGLHRNLVANTLQFKHWLHGLEEGKEVVLTAIPLYHVYGMVIAMSMGIALGATLVMIHDPRDVQDILRNIDIYNATLFPGVPSMYNAINQHPDVLVGKFDLTSIKACISGSAPLMRETKERFEKLTGGKLLEGYGLSEAPTATHCNPMLGENRVGSIGLPLPDVECRIIYLDDENKVVKIGDTGELVLRGPQVMWGYHNMPHETELVLRGGWLHTGDIARMDSEGYFYLVDRRKELIKIGGFQVWPREIEEVIANYHKVLEVAVAGVPDPSRGEIVKAWVVIQPDQSAGEDEIRKECIKHLARYKVPSLVEFRNELPRTTVGKVLRRELVRQHIESMKRK